MIHWLDDIPLEDCPTAGYVRCPLCTEERLYVRKESKQRHYIQHHPEEWKKMLADALQKTPLTRKVY